MLLQYPPYSIPYRIVGIDPGSVTLGACVIDLDLQTRTETLVDVRTFDASKNMRDYHNLSRIHGDRCARLQIHEDSLTGYFSVFKPHAIISEAPFLGRFPQAFAALTECVTAIRRAVMRYDRFMPLHIADPMTVKSAVGVHRMGRKDKGALSKENVHAAVMQLPLLNPGQIDLASLDEHSIDAIAVARSRIVTMYQP